jgi:hypothetical protein
VFGGLRAREVMLCAGELREVSCGIACVAADSWLYCVVGVQVIDGGIRFSSRIPLSITHPRSANTQLLTTPVTLAALCWCGGAG